MQNIWMKAFFQINKKIKIQLQIIIVFFMQFYKNQFIIHDLEFTIKLKHAEKENGIGMAILNVEINFKVNVRLM